MLIDTALLRRFNAIAETTRNLIGLGLLALGGFALSRNLPLPAAALMILIAGLVAIAAPEAIAAGTTIAIPLIFHPVAIRNQHFSLLELALICGIGGLAVRTAVADPSRSTVWLGPSV